MENRRRVLSFLLALAFLSVCGTGWGVEEVKPPGGKPYAEGRLLVKFKGEVAQDRIQEIFRQTGTEVTRFLRTLKVYVLRLPPGASVDEMVKKFQALPEVEYAEPDYTVTIQEKPEGPRVK
jgi:hypothetical protein